jgi:hypothetical protein
MNPELIKKFRLDLKKYNLKIDPDVINYAKHLGIRTTRARVAVDPTTSTSTSPKPATSAAAPAAGASNTPKPVAAQPTSPQVISVQQQLIKYIQANFNTNDKLDALKHTLVDKVKGAQDVQKLKEIASLLQQIVQEIKQAAK